MLKLKSNESRSFMEKGSGRVTTSWAKGVTASVFTAFMVMPLRAQDFGDAPSPYPVVSHQTTNEEWLAASVTSTTTNEVSSLTPDLDVDDAGAIVYCLAAPVSGVCDAVVAVPVGVAKTSVAGLRYLNVVIDMNRNGVFGDTTGTPPVPLEHIIRDLPVNVPVDPANVLPGAVMFVLVRGVRIQGISSGMDLWVRATLTRSPIGIVNWDGSGAFPFGETEDVNLLVVNQGVPPLFPPVGGPIAPVATKSCVNPLPTITGVIPAKAIPVPQAPAFQSFSLTGCGGACCARVDIQGCRLIGGNAQLPGPDISTGAVGPLGFFCNLPVVVPPLPGPGAGVVGGAGRVSSLARPTVACGGFPRKYPFDVTFRPPVPGAVDGRRWRCKSVFVFDPAGTAVAFYDNTEIVPGLAADDVILVEPNEGVCGNGTVEAFAGEQCDPPGQQGGGGCAMGQICNLDCQCANPVPGSCGNGMIDAGEVCDPLGQVGCMTAFPRVCKPDCSGCTTCGNGTVDSGPDMVEACDPSAQPDGCPAGQACDPICTQCLALSLCGNGAIDPLEACDPSAQPDGCPAGQACDPICTQCLALSLCGNGAIDPLEVCDPSASPSGCTGSETCKTDCSACLPTIPAVSHWGLLVMLLLLLAAGAFVLHRSARKRTF